MSRKSKTELESSNAVTFEIPIRVTIELGSSVLANAAGFVSPSIAASSIVNSSAIAQADVEKVPIIFPDLESRTGYHEDFLEAGSVPMPQLTAAGKAIAAKIDDGTHVLNYHKFSLIIHKRRRLALFTASNVDWRDTARKINGKKPSRKVLNGFTDNEKEDWVIDPRIPFDHQLPDYFYVKDSGAFDRGHLVRRDDVAWGASFEDMQKGNGDTFHTTNCSPQMAGFNQSKFDEFNWGGLENMIQKQTKSEKVCVFSGPVLTEDDQFFHGLVKSGVKVSIQIPKRFWKVIVAEQDNALAAFGFVLDQDLTNVNLFEELAIPNAWRQYLRSIAEIETMLNGLASFGQILQWDQFEQEVHHG